MDRVLSSDLLTGVDAACGNADVFFAVECGWAFLSNKQKTVYDP
jgi:hypothetical protein